LVVKGVNESEKDYSPIKLSLGFVQILMAFPWQQQAKNIERQLIAHKKDE